MPFPQLEMTAVELDKILNGNRKISIEQLYSSTIYKGGYTAQSETVLIFWDWLIVQSAHVQRRVLAYATSSSRIPYDGFSPPFTITAQDVAYESQLPMSHTCFNSLVLPRYTSFEEMNAAWTVALRHGGEGFGLV